MVHFQREDNGRSMTEMLGVLAIMAVLTVGAIMGYNYAITKHKTNVTVRDLELNLVSFNSQLIRMTPPFIPNTALSLENGPKTSMGYALKAYISEANPEYFEVELSSVEQRVCRQLLKDYTKPIIIFVNEVEYTGDTDICSIENSTMLMVFNPDFIGRPPCSDKGYFDPASYKCKCAGNTYFNPFTQDCSCPAGYIWSEKERNCIESMCEEGQFETANDGCKPCNDPTLHQVAPYQKGREQCGLCPERLYYANGASAYCKHLTCEKGVNFFDGNQCVLCSTPDLSITIAKENQEAIEQCSACPNRVTFLTYCVRTDVCEAGKTFFALPTMTFRRECHPCDVTDDIFKGEYRVNGTLDGFLVGGMDGTAYAERMCNACTNDKGQKNRAVIGDYCKKILCNGNEFMGKDGTCYDCSNQLSVAVNASGSGCEETSCGRKIVDGMCRLDDCPTATHIRLHDGSCYECADKNISFKTDTATECEQGCKQRRWLSDGYCLVNTCKKGETVPWNGSSILCQPCANTSGGQDGNVYSGSSDWAREYCEACPADNYISGGYCYYGQSCKRGEQFRSNGTYFFCTDCSLTAKVYIGFSPEQDKMCTDCATTKRFVADGICFRCDTPETPAVFLPAERASCQACGIRTVENGNCVLNKNEN